MEILAIEKLTERDLAGLRPKTVKQVKAMHHAVAEMAASGMKNSEIARAVGRTPPTIANWRAVPANAELEADYRERFGAERKDQLAYRRELREKLAILALERMVDALEAGEEISFRDCLSAAGDSDDRTGLARTETRVNLNASIGARLDRARKRITEAKRAAIVELKPIAPQTYGLVRRI